MMRLISVCLCLGLLAACGADGPPTRPSKAQVAPSGITISGEARMGVVGRSMR